MALVAERLQAPPFSDAIWPITVSFCHGTNREATANLPPRRPRSRNKISALTFVGSLMLFTSVTLR